MAMRRASIGHRKTQGVGFSMATRSRNRPISSCQSRQSDDVPNRGNSAAHQDLPAGESYVVVFNNTPDVNYSRILRGDTIQYVLELEY